MKAAIFLVGASAILTSASPIRAPIEERAMFTETVVVNKIVTVTAGQGPEPTQPSVVLLEEPEPEVVVVTKTTVIGGSSRRPKTRRPNPRPIFTTVKQESEPEPTITEEEPTPEKEEPKPTTTKKEPKPEPTETEDEDSGSGSDYDLSLDRPYNDVLLAYHNVHRANHSAPDLTWDTELAGYAQTIAEGCVFEHDMNQGNGGYGQNLASWGTTGDMDNLKNWCAASGVSNQWYNGEMPNWNGLYGAENPPDNLDIHLWGHFTQVVWKKTTRVGCHTAKCPAGSVLSYPSWYTVCNYGPPGNFGGQYGENVLEPKGRATVTVKKPE